MRTLMRNGRPGRRTTVPGIDHLEARQLLSAAPAHFHAEPLRHYHAAVAEMGRHVHHRSAGVSPHAASPAATSTNFSVVPSPSVPQGTLVATAAIADNDIWAVGRGGGRPRNSRRALRWDELERRPDSSLAQRRDKWSGRPILRRGRRGQPQRLGCRVQDWT
jgi:hypothetical protein